MRRRQTERTCVASGVSIQWWKISKRGRALGILERLEGGGTVIVFWIGKMKYQSAQGTIPPERRLPSMIPGAMVRPPGRVNRLPRSPPKSPHISWSAPGSFSFSGGDLSTFMDVHLNVANSAILGNIVPEYAMYFS
ncbi:hypothetical protein F5Y05DRAFT_244121 [Hypoxylon sp. FL0543]|nr:hypothetical protein F5Y05DRAFT_244121 [Hypoxylon sp. FL0543]